MSWSRLVLAWLAAATAWAGPASCAEPPAAGALPRASRPAHLLPRTLAAGLAAGGGSLLVPRKQTVPRSGLDPAGIAWAVDRNAVRPRGSSAAGTSNRFLAASVAYPAAVSLALAGSGGRRLEGVLTQVQASLLASGVAAVLKAAVSRPRPYTHLHLYDRSDAGADFATSDSAFESFPSGHATLAWAATSAGAVFLARSRPDLPPAVHAANGFLGGALATATALYRVEAGVHFPTDVAAGSVLGAAVGIAVPLAQVPGRPGSGRALRWSLAGALAGAAAAILVAPTTSPF